MMSDKFILKKEDLPDELRKDSFREALDGLCMNPMERELHKKKMLGCTSLRYRDDLVREFIEYYDMEPSFFNIEIMGIDSNIVDELEESFKEYLREAFDVIYYKPKSKSPNVFRLLVVSKRNNIDSFETEPALETKQRAPDTVLECVGYLDIGVNDRLVLCIIFDRFYNKHGFVVFGVDFKSYNLKEEEEKNGREEGT